MSGWSFTGGIPTNTNQSNVPTGTWDLGGGSKRPNMTMTEGSCPGYIPLSRSLSKENSSCPGTTNCDGSISIYAFNGIPPYSKYYKLRRLY